MFLRWLAGRTSFCDRKAGFGERRFRPQIELLETRALLSGGGLNPHFGVGGVVTTGFGGNYNLAAAVATQADGKIVVAGENAVLTSGQFTSEEIALARYKRNGALDQSFGTGGKVVTPIGAFDYAVAVAIEKDGKIVVAGGVEDLAATFIKILVVRYNRDGSLDRGFGTGGSVITAIPGEAFAFTDGLALTDDGRIVVIAGGQEGLAVVKYNANGSLDQHFGTGGIVETSSFRGPSTPLDPSGLYTDPEGNAIVVDGAGRIVVAGFATPGPRPFVGTVATLLRYTPDGVLDSLFGYQGVITNVFGVTGYDATAVALRRNGKIVVAGRASDPLSVDDDFALEQFLPNGTPDIKFGFYGIVATATPNEDMDVTGIAIAPNSDIVLVGSTFNLSNQTAGFAMARYTPNGNLDTSFGSGGIVTTFPSHGFFSGFAVAIGRHGDIIVVGTAFDPSTSQSEFAVVEYLPR
jgi:uncharacterized delta-60 repeat protein